MTVDSKEAIAKLKKVSELRDLYLRLSKFKFKKANSGDLLSKRTRSQVKTKTNKFRVK